MRKVIIIGAGLAGCYLATQLQTTCDVTIITKKSAQDSNSMLAQGGIAASLDPGDTPAEHEADTLVAGAHHNKKTAVKQLVTTGPTLIKRLIAAGMPFDRKADGQLDFGLEGAHSHHRVLHANGDRTGAALTSFVQSLLHQVHWQPNSEALQLIIQDGVCTGVVVRNTQTGQLTTLNGDAVVLATGGLGNLYPLTTNNATITGDGIAMAARAGAKLTDMAYMQFHPTLLTLHGRCYGLITEAIRGSGAILVDENNHRIMANVPQKDLAPRDVVARHLQAWQRQGHDLFLDISPIPNFTDRFPGVSENLDNHHVPFRTTKRIPIQPGAHFLMGGVATDLSAQTSLPHLFAVGEVACNGVHGANRLASNSLLDCLVSAKKAAEKIMTISPTETFKNSALPKSRVDPFLPTMAELQDKAWQYLGVVRSRTGLKTFLRWLDQFDYPSPVPTQLTPTQLTIANLCLCAEKIAGAAQAAPKSLGANYIEESVVPNQAG